MKGNRDDYRADAPASARDRAATGPQVVFYQLTHKFVDDERSIPEEAADVMYYTLAVGHHTGVIDCFEEKLRCGLDVFRRAVALLEEGGDARYKLEAVLRGGEVQIERQHAAMLQEGIASALDGTPTDCEESLAEEREWLSLLRDMLSSLEANGAAYIVGRRREA